MSETPIEETIDDICLRDPRYSADAYYFLREALDFTVTTLNKPRQGPEKDRHISGRELLDGIRRYAIQEFGPMSLSVLKSWGVTTTADFGEIVFNLVESGKLGKTENDRKEDFHDIYDFEDAFNKPFLPGSGTRQGQAPGAGPGNTKDKP